MTQVFPVEGLFLKDVPAAEHECSGKGEHALCVASGAFTAKPPSKRAEVKPSQTPPDGGVSDSTEE